MWKINFARTTFPAHLFAIAAIMAICLTASYAQSKKQEAAAIRYARNISVSRVEKGMPLIRFDKWFRSLGRRFKLKVHYEINDCGEQTGTSADRGRDFPMCVEATGKPRSLRYRSI